MMRAATAAASVPMIWPDLSVAPLQRFPSQTHFVVEATVSQPKDTSWFPMGAKQFRVTAKMGFVIKPKIKILYFHSLPSSRKILVQYFSPDVHSLSCAVERSRQPWSLSPGPVRHV